MNSKALDVKGCGNMRIPVVGPSSPCVSLCSGCRELPEVRQDGEMIVRGS